jgi:DNA invertase Pin-like site-specific DNA recombinase
LKVAIYARYSSDNQRDASIADQLRVCREFAARQGWTVVQEFTDHAVSGATLLRSGFQALMRDALNHDLTSSSPKRSIDSAGTRRTRPDSSSVSRSPA